jgi:hypothetical protein
MAIETDGRGRLRAPVNSLGEWCDNEKKGLNGAHASRQVPTSLDGWKDLKNEDREAMAAELKKSGLQSPVTQAVQTK